MSDSTVLSTSEKSSTDPFNLAIEMFLAAKTAERCTAWTLRNYRRALARFATWADKQGITRPNAVTTAHFRAYLAQLIESGLKASSVHDYARPVKTWLRFLFSEGIIPDNPTARVKLPRQDTLILPAFTAENARRLLDACKESNDPERDTALVLCLLDTGCRAAEFCALTVGDVDTKTGTVSVRRGKGGKGRVVYIGARAKRALLRYLLTRPNVNAKAPLFPSHNTDGHLTVSGLRHFCLRLGARGDVSDCHPHTFRRTFALESLRAGMNIYALQKLMGHADLTILRRYLSLVEQDLQAAHEQHGAVDRLLSKGG